MGEKKKRKHSSSDSDGPSKKRSKKDKKKKDKKKKEKKKEKKKKKKDKKKRKKKDVSSTSSGSSDVCPTLKEVISKDDYFEKSNEFRMWLKEAKNKIWQDMDREAQRKYFEKFVRAWNKGTLGEDYYTGVRDKTHAGRTAHQWKISMNFDDELKLSDTKEVVQHFTHERTIDPKTGMMGRKREAKKKPIPAAMAPPRSKPAGRSIGPAAGPPPRAPTRPAAPGPSIGPSIGPSMGPPASAAPLDEEEEAEQKRLARAEHKHKLKHFRRDEKTRMDELVPKETGHEARLQKKRADNAARKEVGRARAASPEISADVLMGGKDDFQARLAARKNARQRRDDKTRAEYSEKLTAYQQKEKATMDAFKLEMGLPLD